MREVLDRGYWSSLLTHLCSHRPEEGNVGPAVEGCGGEPWKDAICLGNPLVSGVSITLIVW